MDYRFNAAKALVDQDIRPRLFFGPGDIPTIRQGLDFSAGRSLWKAFVNKAGILAGQVLATEDMPTTLAEWSTSWDRPGTRIVFGLTNVAALAVLNDDAQALEACRRVIAACAEAEALSRDGGRKRLGYMAGRYIAPAYDIVAGHLTPDERQGFCQWASRHAVRETLEGLDPGLYFGPGANIPVVGACSAFITALCLKGDRYAPVDDDAIERLTQMVEAALGCTINPDGYPMEDIGYGTGMTGLLANAVECAPFEKGGSPAPSEDGNRLL